MERRFHIVLLSGGTGGHIFPALAVWEASRDFPNVEILLAFGNPHLKDLPAEAIVYETPRLRPLLKGVWRLHHVFRIAWEWRKRLQSVDAVIGFGSYASFPALLGAWWAGVPFYLQEQNVIPGRVTRFMAPLARKIFLSYPSTKAAFPQKGVWLGNPIRPSLLQPLSREEARKIMGLPPNAWVVGVLGGSQGARGLMEKVLPVLGQMDVLGLVLTGEGNWEWASERFRQYTNLRLIPFEKDMRRFYRAVDVVISRAGGGAIGELLVFRIPTLLVPFPYAADDHQTKNAQEMARLGAMGMVQEADLHPRIVSTWLARMRSPHRRKKVREAMERVARPRAAWDLLSSVLEDVDNARSKK